MSGFKDFDAYIVENVSFDTDFWAEEAFYNDSTSSINIIMYQNAKTRQGGELRESENSTYSLFVKGTDVGEPSIGDTVQYSDSTGVYYTITSLVGNHGNVFECITEKQVNKSGNTSRNLRNFRDA
jgi:hypothetical protein